MFDNLKWDGQFGTMYLKENFFRSMRGNKMAFFGIFSKRREARSMLMITFSVRCRVAERQILAAGGTEQ
jgi:hypothetical protein